MSMHTIVPLGPCEHCGVYDQRDHPLGIAVHLFRRDHDWLVTWKDGKVTNAKEPAQ